MLTGDANGDGLVSIADVTATVNHLLGKSVAGFDATAADANGDGTITVADVNAIVNIILSKK